MLYLLSAFAYFRDVIMKTRVFISTLLILILAGCKVAMQQGGELINTPYNIIEQDGKSLWLIYRDSSGTDYEDENGIHKIKYSTFRFLKKRKVITEYFNLNGNYLDTTSVLEYAQAKEVWKKDKLIELCFMDSSKNLVQPSYFNHAKMKQKYFKDGSWRVRYFDSNNQLTCNNGVSEQRFKWDTIRQINEADTTYMLSWKSIGFEICTEE